MKKKDPLVELLKTLEKEHENTKDRLQDFKYRYGHNAPGSDLFAGMLQTYESIIKRLRVLV